MVFVHGEKGQIKMIAAWVLARYGHSTAVVFTPREKPASLEYSSMLRFLAAAW